MTLSWKNACSLLTRVFVLVDGIVFNRIKMFDRISIFNEIKEVKYFNPTQDGRGVHSTSWKFSTWWKFGLYFVYIFIADWNFLTKFCSSDPSFNGNILTLLYLKSETSAHAQICDYLFIHTIYKFHGMVLAENSRWGYLLINGVYR